MPETMVCRFVGSLCFCGLCALKIPSTPFALRRPPRVGPGLLTVATVSAQRDLASATCHKGFVQALFVEAVNWGVKRLHLLAPSPSRCERAREGERQRDRETDRERETQRHRETQRERETERETLKPTCLQYGLLDMPQAPAFHSSFLLERALKGHPCWYLASQRADVDHNLGFGGASEGSYIGSWRAYFAVAAGATLMEVMFGYCPHAIAVHQLCSCSYAMHSTRILYMTAVGWGQWPWPTADDLNPA